MRHTLLFLGGLATTSIAAPLGLFNLEARDAPHSPVLEVHQDVQNVPPFDGRKGPLRFQSKVPVKNQPVPKDFKPQDAPVRNSLPSNPNVQLGQGLPIHLHRGEVVSAARPVNRKKRWIREGDPIPDLDVYPRNDDGLFNDDHSRNDNGHLNDDHSHNGIAHRRDDNSALDDFSKNWNDQYHSKRWDSLPLDEKRTPIPPLERFRPDPEDDDVPKEIPQAFADKKSAAPIYSDFSLDTNVAPIQERNPQGLPPPINRFPPAVGSEISPPIDGFPPNSKPVTPPPTQQRTKDDKAKDVAADAKAKGISFEQEAQLEAAPIAAKAKEHNVGFETEAKNEWNAAHNSKRDRTHADKAKDVQAAANAKGISFNQEAKNEAAPVAAAAKAHGVDFKTEANNEWNAAHNSKRDRTHADKAKDVQAAANAKGISFNQEAKNEAAPVAAAAKAHNVDFHTEAKHQYDQYHATHHSKREPEQRTKYTKANEVSNNAAKNGVNFHTEAKHEYNQYQANHHSKREPEQRTKYQKVHEVSNNAAKNRVDFHTEAKHEYNQYQANHHSKRERTRQQKVNEVAANAGKNKVDFHTEAKHEYNQYHATHHQ